MHLLYWYRFCTAKQLAHSFKKPSPKAIQNRLQILEEQSFIGKRYDKSYKLQGRPAEYYITPKGSRALEKVQPNTTNQWATKSLYKNKTVSDDFLKHTIAVTDASKHLRALYGNKVEILTKSYMVQFDSYPPWTPDLHIKIPARGETPAKHYLVDIWDGTKPFFVTVRKTRNYVNFKESGNWEEDEQFPAVLAICENTQLQKKLNRQMKRILSDAWDDELIFATTTEQLLEAATKPTDKIWLKTDADDAPEPTSLKGLITVL
ncbi:MAG: replication-relaxation family protein [Candidatus Saccharimonadales bacterium]